MLSGKCPSVTGSMTLHFSSSAPKISIALRTGDGAHEFIKLSQKTHPTTQFSLRHRENGQRSGSGLSAIQEIRAGPHANAS